MADKPGKLEFTSPRGVLVWPDLITPSYGSKEHPVPDGKWKARLRLDTAKPAVRAFLTKLQPFHDAAVAKAEEAFKGLKAETRKKLGKVTVNPLYTELLDKETEEPTGEIEFSFSKSYIIRPKKGKNAGKIVKLYVPLFDGRGNTIKVRNSEGDPLKSAPAIWSGTEAHVSFSLRLIKDWDIPGYFIPGTGIAGVAFELEAVQIKKLVSGGGKDANAYGFEADDDGYDASALAEDDEEVAAPDGTTQSPDF